MRARWRVLWGPTFASLLGTMFASEASPVPARSPPIDRFTVADARSVRHCHTIRTRTYCHKSGALPVNWPPLTNSEVPGRLG